MRLDKRKVVLKALRFGKDAYYSTEANQDEWSEGFVGNYTSKIENAIVFDSLTRAFEYVKGLEGGRNMLFIEPMWLEEINIVPTLVAKEIK